MENVNVLANEDRYPEIESQFVVIDLLLENLIPHVLNNYICR
jgi:hypothetical protein